MSAIRNAFGRQPYVGGSPSYAERLVWTYRHERQHGMTARAALDKARRLADLDLHKWPDAGGIGAPFMVGREACRWIESPADHGFRLVGPADEVARSIGHTGWFLDDDGCDGKARGAVYRLPASHGRERFVAAVLDAFNEGPAIVAPAVTDDATTAALWADQLAERYAFGEREWRRANDARFQHDQLGEEIAAARKECLGLIREAKAACGALAGFDQIRRTIRAAILDYVAETRATRRTRAELRDAFEGEPGWIAV